MIAWKLYSSICWLAIMVSLSAYSQEYKKVEAREGDNIVTLLNRYNLDSLRYYDSFLVINRYRLNPDLKLIKGKIYFLPIMADAEPVTSVEAQPALAAKVDAPKTSNIYPIFGKKYERVEIKDQKLRGAVYYIVAGHGGPDPGAMGKKDGHTLCEDEYAYDVCLRLARNLLERGATVYIITIDPNDGIRDEPFLKCDKDELSYGNLPIPLNSVERLKQKVDAVNQLYEKHRGQFQRKIEIHVDSRYEDKKVDIFFYYHPGSEQGRRLGEILLSTIRAKYAEHQPRRGYTGTVTERKLYTLKNSKPVGIYIELGNINHPKDQERLIIVNNRQAIANWLTLGLIKEYEQSRK